MRRSRRRSRRAARGRAHIDLPDGGELHRRIRHRQESWSGYNWYQGNYRSLIQVNTDLPIYIDRAIDLACHEGYPGHHVYNVLLEKTSRARSRVDGVLGVSAVLAAVADRGGHGELRHRGRVSAAESSSSSGR